MLTDSSPTRLLSPEKTPPELRAQINRFRDCTILFFFWVGGGGERGGGVKARAL